MGLFDFLSKQFVDVIDWEERSGDLAIRYPFKDREIQNGAQLTVRDGQTAFFYDQGHIADAFGPGLHTLETANLPMLTGLMNWNTGFKSPFKADLRFFTLKEQAGLKWGTPQPITVRDKDFGPLRVRAFGSYSFRIRDVPVFAVKLMGTLEQVRVADVEPQLRGAISTALASALGRGDIAFVDLAANQQALSEHLRQAVAPAFEAWGLEVASFFVESVSLPEEVQAHLDKASSMRVVGDLDRFVRFQAATAIENAAAGSGNVTGMGAEVAAAAMLGRSMSAGLNGTPANGEDAFALIEKLHKLHVAGAISEAEYETKKAALLAKIG